ncbi:MAG: 50S ribosomal protein L10 [Limnochordaceae bacterium]|nr:50S ribosomal protein L10 [Limnochordaceae bacterium]
MAKKRAVVEGVGQRLQRSQAVFLTDFRGLNVAAMTRLRRRLRESQAEYLVAKNTLIRRAAGDLAKDGLEPLLQGPTGICFAYGDPVAVAKALAEFARESRILAIKGGVLQGRVLSSADVETLAQLPPRDVLLAQALGMMKAPMSGLVAALSGVMRKLVVALEEIRKQKEAAGAQPTAAG